LPKLTTWTPPGEMEADIADALGDLRTWARAVKPGESLVGVLS